MIRAFVAVDLADSVREELAAVQRQLQRRPVSVRVAWARLANLHLTLQFLGDIPSSAVDAIGAQLTAVAARLVGFDVMVRGLGGFPTMDRARVIWAGCDDASGNLGALAGAVHEALESLGFPRDSRPFVAHLTLGRIKHPRPDAALTQAVASLKNKAFGTFRVDAIHLFQSQLHPAGSIYTKLSSHNLKES